MLAHLKCRQFIKLFFQNFQANFKGNYKSVRQSVSKSKHYNNSKDNPYFIQKSWRLSEVNFLYTRKNTIQPTRLDPRHLFNIWKRKTDTRKTTLQSSKLLHSQCNFTEEMRLVMNKVVGCMVKFVLKGKNIKFK